MATEKEYFAFISYKKGKEDEKWAKWLAHKLDSFKLPSSLNGKEMPNSLRKTFRDVDELSAGNLPKQIYNALSMADNLIVVCSPRSVKSEWVNKEIEDFIKIKGDKFDHIFPFIIEGEPFSKDETKECFPEKLRKLPKNEERLGGNINEQGGRNAAVVKVVAGMLGVSFDSLWNRFEREQKRKRWIWTGVAALFTFIGLGVGMYFVSQNRIIESQNVQLQKLVRNLEEENNTYSQLQSDQKQYTYVGQLRGYDSNNLSTSLIVFHPYEPIIAFIDNWGIWLHYISSNLEVKLPDYYKGEQILDYSGMCFSTDGTKLMAYGRTVNNYDWADYIWDIEDNKLIGRIMQDDIFPIRKNEITKIQNANLLEKINYACRNGLLNIYDIIKHKTICSTNFNSNDIKPDCIYNPTYDEILFISEDRAALYDDNKEDFVLFFKGYNSYEFSECGDYLRIDNNIFERTIKIDTIQHLNYLKHRIDNYPNTTKENDQHYDATSHASLNNNQESVEYRCGDYIKNIKVVRDSIEVGQREYLCDAIFAGAHKIIAIVERGCFRIYSTHSWSMLGTLNNYIGTSEYIGHEEDLSFYSNCIVMTKYINNKLYVVSSGGIIRIYDVNKCRLEKVIELPMERIGVDLSEQTIDKCDLSDDGSKILYSFEGQSIYYECKLTLK